MSGYPPGSREDREMLAKMPMEKLLDYFFLEIRNLWRVDGLYFLGIEKKFGTEAATEIDAGVWETMAAIEAKSLQKMFNIGENPDVPTIIDLLRKSSWALDQPFKTVEVSSKRGTLSVDRCRTQETRLIKGLSEFPCKKVRFGYLKNFAKTLNPNVEVDCIVCPPDKHPKNLWCKWEFRL
ncbi:MAG: DUF6125 family protein [Candidatus Bathyarchaeota archaeon]|jgi:hypothetical protein|nr:hypothetical protein [Candidatus Bathyarchaeota archaeon A05DMB-5]MDH7558520.1 DUF6125 family protein [Candidatus Bathyarchaeota archaeon]